jgi:hypothetical protein
MPRTMQPGYSMYSLSRSGQFFRFSSTFSLRVMKVDSASTVRSCGNKRGRVGAKGTKGKGVEGGVCECVCVCVST